MLAIRLQRTGRKGHPQYRMIVQDSRFSPKSERVVQYLGSYNPHTKEAKIDAETSAKYLANGAQPSDRAASILKEAGVKLPKWYSPSPSKKRGIKNPEKLRKNRPAGAESPAEEPVAKAEETPAEESATEGADEQAHVEDSPKEPETDTADKAAAETPEEPAAKAEETPAEEPTK